MKAEKMKKMEEMKKGGGGRSSEKNDLAMEA